MNMLHTPGNTFKLDSGWTALTSVNAAGYRGVVRQCDTRKIGIRVKLMQDRMNRREKCMNSAKNSSRGAFDARVLFLFVSHLHHGLYQYHSQFSNSSCMLLSYSPTSGYHRATAIHPRAFHPPQSLSSASSFVTMRACELNSKVIDMRSSITAP